MIKISEVKTLRHAKIVLMDLTDRIKDQEDQIKTATDENLGLSKMWAEQNTKNVELQREVNKLRAELENCQANLEYMKGIIFRQGNGVIHHKKEKQ